MIHYVCDVCDSEIPEKADVRRLWYRGDKYEGSINLELCRACAKKVLDGVFAEFRKHNPGEDESK